MPKPASAVSSAPVAGVRRAIMVGKVLAWSRHALATSHTNSPSPRRVTGSTRAVDVANECPPERPGRAEEEEEEADGDEVGSNALPPRKPPTQAAAMASRCGASHSPDTSGSASSCSCSSVSQYSVDSYDSTARSASTPAQRIVNWGEKD